MDVGGINFYKDEMSYWHEPKPKDWDVSDDGKDMHIYLESDDSGNIYVSLKIAELKEFLKKYDNRSNTPPMS